MSATIDERVVSMQFDNKNFENNVKTSMNTLESLKKSLNLTGAAKGLENIDSAAKSVNMSGLGNAVETVQAKFSALGVMAVTTLANITNSAVNAGKRMVSAFTIDPIKTGLQEYETQINAVQTILANTQSKGTTLDQVNSALDQLNTYADKTIYNFTEMTRNIGTFTAAGVDLDTSVASIQGIANLAAVSGSSSQQASTAMYQLSQALAAGKVSLMDWNSVVNAGMGGQLFQEALTRTADNMGKNATAIIDQYGSFRESLTKGEWLTTEVLTETLKQLSGAYTEADLIAQGYTEEQAREITELADTAVNAATKVKTFTQLVDTLKEAAQSGWTQTWEILIGDFEEAKELWTAVSDELGAVIGASAEQRNNMLQGWADEGGRAMLIESLSNAYQGLKAVIVAVSEAFREVFPPMTSEQLLKFTEGIKNLSERFREFAENHAPKFKSTFKGIFSVIDILVTAVKAVASGIVSLIGKFTGLGEGVLTVTGSIGDWLSGLRDSVKETDIFGKAIDAIVGFLGAAIDKIREFGGYLKSKFSAPGFEGFLNVLQSIWNLIKTVGGKIVEVASGIGKALSDALSFDNLSSALDLASGGIFVGILLGIKKFINGITEAFGTSEDGFLGTIKGAFEGIADTLSSVGESLQAWQQNLQAGTLQKIATAIAILAAALLVLSLIDPAKLTTALSAITVLFAELMASMAIFNKIGMISKGVIKSVIAMIGIAAAILILAGALKTIASLDMNQMMTGLLGIAGLMTIVVVAMKALAKGGKVVIKGAANMIIMALALKIFASVCKDLGALSWEQLGKGLAGIAGVLLIFVGFQALMKLIKPQSMLSSATSLLIIGAAMMIFADVCKQFGQLEWGSLAKAGAAMGGILALAAGFALLSGLSNKMIQSSAALVIIGAAMEIFADVSSKFGAMKWESLAKAGIAIAGILVLAAGFVLLAGLSTGMIKSVAALTIMAVAMEIFADVCGKFGSMNWEALAKAGTAIAGILLLSAGFALLAGLAPGILTASASLVVMAVALNMLTPVLTKLGSMSWEAIAKGLIAIAGAFTIIGLAGYLLGPIVPAILALAGGVALLGLGCLAAGAGILALAAGLGALAAAGVGAATAIVASLQIIIGGIIDLIPLIIQKIGEGIILLCDVIAGSVESIGAAVKAIVLTIIDVLVECIPAIANGALQLILGVLDALTTYAPQVVAALFQFVISIIEGLATHIPELIVAVVDVFAAIFEGAAEALKNIDPKMFMQGVLSVGMMAGMVAALAAVAGLIPAAMIGALGIAGVLAELGLLAQIPGLDWLINESAGLMESIGKAIGGFVGGLAGGVMSGVTSSLPDVGANLSAFMANLQPFIEGAKSIDPTLANGILALSQMILTLTGANILDSITSWATGGSSLSDFAAQLVPFGTAMKQFASEVAGIDASAVASAAAAGQAIAELASALPNSGGVAGFFAGENDMDILAEQLVPFGTALRQFATQVAGIDAESVSNAAKAGSAIAEMASIIPNEGGMVAWFTGDNSIASFGTELAQLGEGLKGFAESVAGVDTEGIVAAAGAAKALADMASVVPNEGGVSAWFAGENSVAVFSGNLTLLGLGLKGFSDAIVGIVPENITAAANAAKALAEMTASIPNEGGMAAWFAGDNSVATFSANLILLGLGLKGFATAVEGIVPENVTAAANAAKALAEMANTVPNEGGMVAWFTGDNSLSKFSTDLTSLGEGLKGFSDSIEGINPANVTAAANAAKALAEMTAVIPNEGGVVAWFTGDNSLSAFADKLPALGDGLKNFSDSVEGINPGNVTAAANAAKTLAEMTSTVPGNTDKLTDFGDNLVTFGGELSEYFESTAGITDASIAASTGAIECVKSVENLDSSSITSASEAIQSMVDALNSMSTVGPATAAGFAATLKELGTVSADAFVSAFKAIENDMSTCGTEAINKFAAAVRNANSAISSCNTMVARITAAIRVKYNSFYSAGAYLVQGFANGISANTYMATARARAMANAAESAAKAALDSHSPSRVFIEIGKYVPQGFAIGISALGNKVKSAASGMANTALNGTKNAISRIASVLDSDMDAQPTIRPVLDLSEVSAGASSINSMFGMRPSVGVQGALSSINSAMNRRIQNGADSEVVTAINKLRKDVGNLENKSYNVGTISYSAGDEVSNAIETLVRAIRVEGRA